MELNNLIAYRKIVPGIVLFVLAIPLLYNNLDELMNFVGSLNLENLIFLIPIVVLGVIYSYLDLTKIIWDPVKIEIDRNIKNELLTETIYSETEKEELKKGNKLINIFFELIDSDESLTQKKKRVYQNGLILTSICDIGVISIIYAFYSIIKGVCWNNVYNIFLGYGYFLIFFFTMAFLHLGKMKHLALGNDQLEIVKRRMKNELKDKLNEALR